MDFLILALATFRISSLIAGEEGPFGLFDWLRSLIGVKRDDAGKTYGTNSFTSGLTCLWCNSIWVGLPFMVAYAWQNEMTVLVSYPFALSSVVMIIERWTHG